MENNRYIKIKTFTEFDSISIDNKVNTWLTENYKRRDITGFSVIDIKAYKFGNSMHSRCIIYVTNNNDCNNIFDE